MACESEGLPGLGHRVTVGFNQIGQVQTGMPAIKCLK